MREDELKQEIAKLQALILAIAERLAAASAVLSMLAERKDRRGD